MNGRGELKDERERRARFGRRALAGFAIMLALVMVVAGRFVYLQVYEHAEYSTRAKANRVRLTHLAPPRGLIYDREGKVVAAFKSAAPPASGDDEVLAKLKQLLGGT